MLPIRSIDHMKFVVESMTGSVVGDDAHAAELRNHEEARERKVPRRYRGEPNPHIGGLETRRSMRAIHGSAACLRLRHPTQCMTDSLRQDAYANSLGAGTIALPF